MGVLSIRMPDESFKKLDELCEIMQLNRPHYIINLIDTAYDTMQGKPKLKETIQNLNQIMEIVKKMNADLKID